MALNDFFGDSPSYINPDYATDAQRKQQRAYAEMLMKRSSGDITRPTGAIANIIDALTGRLEMNRAGNLEQQALAHSNDQNAALIAALQGNQQPQTTPPVGPMGSVGDSMVPTPTAPTNAPRAEVQSSPKVWGDKEAEAAGLYEPTTKVASLGPAGGGGAPVGSQEQPSVLPTAGAPASPNQRVAQAFDPKLLAGMLTNQMTPPESRALIGQLIGQKQGQDVYGNPTREGIVGGVQALPVGKGVTPGFRSETSISPTGISGTVVNPAANAQPGIQTGGGIGGAMNTMNTLAMNAGKTGAVQEFQKQDLAAANEAPTIKRVAGIMLDDLRTHGDRMTFGPTAEWSNNLKRVAANYLPAGATRDGIEALASADSFDKMSAQLTSLLAKGGGTDAQLFNNMKSVPGAHNSKEGAEALLKMTLQVADQQQALAQAVSAAKTPEEYQQLKAEFYRRNPIVNPLTGNPIALDVKKNNGASKEGFAPPIPKVGDVIDGHRFKGGNPADQKNWEPFT